MKLKRGDEVVAIAGRDKGKSGKVVKVIPAEQKVVVEGINIAKRHTKPSTKHPRGGILEITKPIDVAKVAYLEDGKPTRIGYRLTKAGDKERISKRSGKVLK